MSDYSIREISERFQLPESTLRYYEEMGLLPDVGRNSSGRRVYSDENLGRLEAICCFKEAGMSIPQLRQFFDFEKDKKGNIDGILALLSEHETLMAGKLLRIQQDYAHIQKKIGYYSAIKAALEAGGQPPSWKDYLESLDKM